MNSKFLSASISSILMVAALGLSGCASHTTDATKTSSNSNPQNKNNLGVKVEFKSENGSKATGVGTLTLNKKTHELTAVVLSTGLEPKAKYLETINSGNQKVYDLKALQADAKGEATAMTVIKDVKEIPPSGWVIQIHDSKGKTIATASLKVKE